MIHLLIILATLLLASFSHATTFYVDNKCGTNGNGTTATCGANGPWNSIKNAVQVADCSGMTTGDILEINGDAVKDTTCENGATCYHEDNINIEGACHDIIIQNRANTHVILDGTVDIRGSTWTSIGNGVYQCGTAGCSGDVGDAFAFRAWYDRGVGEEQLNLIQTSTACNTSLASGTMTINTASQSICVKLSNGASPSTTSYFRVPWYDPALQAGSDGMDNITLRKNPSGSGTFRIQRYRKRGIEANPTNAGWVIDGLEWVYHMDRCIAFSSATGAVANVQIRNNTISFCGQEGIRLESDTGSWVIENNTITDIQTEPVFQRCSAIGSGCLPEFTDNGTGIRLINHQGTGGIVRNNRILRLGGGNNSRARGINFEHDNNNIVVERNYIAHMSGLANTGAAIMWSGSFNNDTNDEILVRNNLIYDVDRCFWIQYGTDYDSQSATQNYILNNTCAEFEEHGLLAEWSGNATLDGPFAVKNNVFVSNTAVPDLILSVPSSGSTGWTTLQNNVFECDACATNQDIINWRGNIFERDEDCTATVDCVDDMTTVIGGTYSGQRYGNTNVNVGSGGAVSFPTTSVLDNFNRADEDPLGGIWSENLSGGSSSCRILSNVAVKQAAPAGDGCYVTSNFSSPDQEVYGTLPNATSHTTTSGSNIVFCLQGGVGTSSVDGYALQAKKVDAGTDTVNLARITNAAYTQLGASVNQEVTNGNKVGAERKGSSINFWYDGGSGWTQLFTRTDTTYNCSNSTIGMHLFSTTYQVDDFGGGDIVAESSEPDLAIATPSEADDAGQALTTEVPDDYTGAPRNVTYDAGAYNIGTDSGTAPGTFPTTSVLDNFNRADVDPIGGIWSTGPLGGASGCRIVSNVAIRQAAAPGDGCYVTNAFSDADQEVYATLPNATSHTTTSAYRVFLCLHGGVGTSSVDGYAFRSNKVDAATDTVNISRLTNATFTQLGATENLEVTDGNKVGLERVASDINFWYHNGTSWSELFTRSDSTYNCANSNIGIGTLSSTFETDDFGGGNIVTGPSIGEFVTFGAIQFE
jgi:hypothetical protein